MNFNLTEERQMLSDTLRRYLSDKYDTERRNKILASDQGYSSEIWAEMAELGVIGALFSPEDGGFGGDGFDLAVVFEELGRAGVVEPFLDTGVLAGGLIAAIGNSAHKAHLEGVIEGTTQLAFAHGEPQSRYDLDNVQTVAESRDGAILLTGRKAVVVNGDAADQFVVSARDEDAGGLSLFLVPASSDGLDIQGYPLISGGRAAEVILDGVQVPEVSRLGAPGDALPTIEAVMARATVAQMAESLGAMSTAVDLTQDYLVTRQQFGRPIGTFQALQHRMSEMLIEMEQARSALINAAGHLTAAPFERDRQISAAKSLFGGICRLIAEESIQMHGGIAMTQEYELAHIAKRIMMADHRFGDQDWHLERFIALSAA
ncbi:MAG: acyl-CoA dehydrogenase family protein [Paracoccaceae bacterium]